uniref:Cysteine and histidine-rich domain-containing protein 1 n=1 Tax=Timema bartmani TaxID=61472 RepID=A0A7R9EVM1_9NEOP|nr:unnamed protein product [Timema bartmani]
MSNNVRSSDGRALVVSSTDGYCSIVTFAEGELGKEYKPSKDAQESDGQTPSKSKAEKSVDKTVKDSDNSTLQTSNIKINESHKDIQLASVDIKNESHETPTEIADASDTSKRKEGQTKSPLKLNCTTKEVKVDNKSLSPAKDQTDSKITEEIDTKPSVSLENKKVVTKYCCETSETVEKMEIDDKEACIILPQKASQTKTPTLKSVTAENESLSKSSSDPKATTKGIEQIEPLKKDEELLETAVVSETLDVISSPISEITQTLKSDCRDNEKITSSNDDNLNNTVTDDKCRISEFEPPRTPSKLNSDSTELCDKKSTPSSPAQGQISSPCVTPNQEACGTDLSVLVSVLECLDQSQRLVYTAPHWQGCTKSFHSNIKPPEPEKPVVDKTEADKVIEAKAPRVPLAQSLERPAFTTPLVQLKPEVSSVLKEQVKALVKPSQNNQRDTLADLEIPLGTNCKNNSCKTTYEGPGRSTGECRHHPGYPVFHEGLKYWTCCQKRTTDFNTYFQPMFAIKNLLLMFGYHQPANHGCPISTDQQVNLRFDWHQTAGFVVVSVYGKKYDPHSSTVELSPVRLKIHMFFPEEQGSFDLDLELRGIVNVSHSSASMLPTKLEVKLRKAEPGSWSKLDFPRQQMTKTEQETRKPAPTTEEVANDLDMVDLSDI